MDALSRLSWKLRAANTELIDAATYAEHYDQWGGSFIVHPEVLNFFQTHYGVPVSYAGYFKEGRCVGAVATWGSFVAGDRTAFASQQLEGKVDFGYPIIYVPIAPGQKCLINFKSRYLLPAQRAQLRGAVYPGLKCMALLKQIPEEMPAGKKEFQIKARRFERMGGTVRDIQEFSSAEIVAMYDDLFNQRWGRPPAALVSMGSVLAVLKKFLFGKVLWVEGKAIAIQINYRAETKTTVCIDYVNGGVDKSPRTISPGSLLSYINGCVACEDARRSGKLLLYSYGKANTEYKDQWCNRVARGYTGFWLP
jgi:hypothetical protein